MDIGLVMLVKDEALRVEQALAPIMDHLAQLIVIDTGSTDGTQDLLRERLQIEPIAATLDADRCFSKADLRNQGLAKLQTPWCLTLDADERLDPLGLYRLKTRPPPEAVSGLFLRWRNVTEAGEIFDDYKCAFFRQGIKMTHMVHENAQASLRRNRAVVRWSDEVVLEHRPEASKEAWKRTFYRERLKCAMRIEPDVPRYPWFAGYAAMREERSAEARRLLTRAADSRHSLYPVERLNARVVLTALCARDGDIDDTRVHLGLARKLWDEVRQDFEVQINHWLEPWLEQTAAMVAERKLEGVTAPRFAY